MQIARINADWKTADGSANLQQIASRLGALQKIVPQPEPGNAGVAGG
jgi:hypothetical protein